MTHTADTCLNCAHWRLKEAGAMARHGFGICAKGFTWRFFPPKHTCGKHAPGAPALMAARAKWLERNA